MIVAIIALIGSLMGTAYAAKLGKNSVGTRQLKAKAVTTGKISNNAINSKKVRNNSLTGADVNLNKLGTVPAATSATYATNAATIGQNHAAVCPPGTTLIRGTCYDLTLNPVVAGVKAAASLCAAKGGYLPTPMELYSIRSVINLGTGIAPDYAVADEYYANTSGVNYRTVTVDGAGTIEEIPVEAATRFICGYQLVR